LECGLTIIAYRQGAFRLTLEVSNRLKSMDLIEISYSFSLLVVIISLFMVLRKSFHLVFSPFVKQIRPSMTFPFQLKIFVSFNQELGMSSTVHFSTSRTLVSDSTGTSSGLSLPLTLRFDAARGQICIPRSLGRKPTLFHIAGGLEVEVGLSFLRVAIAHCLRPFPREADAFPSLFHKSHSKSVG
jgi:hypothetical protein